MRALEQGIAGLRATGRRLVSRSGRAVRPARLDLSLVPDGGEALSASEWRRVLVRAVDWLGPVAVHILAPDQADDPLLADLIRFAHRLECRVTLYTNGRGIDTARAEELVDHGLAAVVIGMGGVSDPLQQQLTGASAEAALGALRALGAARADRGLPLDIEVSLAWVQGAATEGRAVLGLARQAGADGFSVVLPHQGKQLDPDSATLHELLATPAPFNRSAAYVAEAYAAMLREGGDAPGASRAATGATGRLPCPVGGERLSVSRSGRLASCPFQAPIVPRVGDVRADWLAHAAPHLQAIRACSRACAHPELAPTPLLG